MDNEKMRRDSLSHHRPHRIGKQVMSYGYQMILIIRILKPDD